MALTYSSMLELGTQMPKFELENTVNNEIFWSLAIKNAPFICQWIIYWEKDGKF